MKAAILLLLFEMSSCGWSRYGEILQRYEAYASPLSNVENPVFAYFEELEGVTKAEITEGRTLWVVPHDMVERSCGPESWGCVNNNGIVASEDANFCQIIAHEVGHLVALLKYETWDSYHVIFGEPYELGHRYLYPVELCKDGG